MKLAFELPGPPIPKMRARKGKHGFYTPKPTVVYERNIGFVAAATVVGVKDWPMDAEYVFSMLAVFEDKSTRDLDNVLKSVLDGCNKILWKDDSQVCKFEDVGRSYDKENPRTVVWVTVA